MTSEAPIHSGLPAFWRESGGEAWARLQDLLDRLNQPIAEALADAAAAAQGARVLDVGCGGGATTLEMGVRLGPSSRCVGIDISAPLLALARRRAEAAGASNVEFIEADAQSHVFEAGEFDAVISRFGVMFFAAPDVAFANLHRALRPGGRLAFVCWRSAAENPLSQAPLEAAAPFLSEIPPARADSPGRFAFADSERVRGLLERTGWRGVDIAPLDVPTPLTFDELMSLSLDLGGLAALLLRESETTRAQIRDAVAARLERHADPDGLVRMTAACWLVTAGP